MAEEKKPEKKFDKKPDKPAPKQGDPFAEIVSFMVGIFVIIFLINGFIRTINSSGLFSHGLHGLTPIGIMENHTRPVASLDNPIGARVVSMKDTAVYDSPAGNQIGNHKFQDKGKILQGYVMEDGVKYWYVDYDTGVDGWVKEGDIAYLQSEPTRLERFIMWLFSIFTFVKIFSWILSIVIIIWVTYLIRELTKLRVNNRKLLYPFGQSVTTAVPNVNTKWEKVLSYVDSLNDNDWRLAIIEADIMLSELVNNLGLPGDSIGEKLKAVEKSDFTTIDNAWEAHKIRNQIAHEGSDFILTQREAKRIISLYQSVFEEFQMV